MRWGTWISGLIAIVVVIAAGGLAYAWRSEIPPNAAAPTFDKALVAHGAEVASAGFCTVCHSAAGKPALAGGRPLETPLGLIYATNITPDRDTGIGTWSEEAFLRAMREGVDRQGHYLYPAFPYDHFTRATDGDLKAVYAFLMTRNPVRSDVPPTKLPFPFNIRIGIAAWNMLFLHKGTGQPPGGDRGAYIADALSHCSACHTPRNLFMAEDSSRPYDGAVTESWFAPAINANSSAPVAWTADQMTTYLRTGWDATHGAASGPMGPVTRGLAGLPESDVRAIATWAVGQMKGRTPPAAPPASPDPAVGLTPASATNSPGASIYAGACASCHDASSDAPFSARPLALHTSLTLADPRNALHVVLNGLHPNEGQRGPQMPAFTGTLTDRQIADVTAYIKTRFGSGPAWSNLEDEVGKLPHGGDDS